MDTFLLDSVRFTLLNYVALILLLPERVV